MHIARKANLLLGENFSSLKLCVAWTFIFPKTLRTSEEWFNGQVSGKKSRNRKKNPKLHTMLKDSQLKLTPNSHYVSEGTLLLLAARKPRILIQLIAHFRCSGVSVQQIWGPQSFVVFISHCRRVCAIHRCLIVPWGWLRWHLLLECLKVPASALLVTCQFEKVPDSWYLWNWSTFFFSECTP